MSLGREFEQRVATERCNWQVKRLGNEHHKRWSRAPLAEQTSLHQIKGIAFKMARSEATATARKDSRPRGFQQRQLSSLRRRENTFGNSAIDLLLCHLQHQLESTWIEFDHIDQTTYATWTRIWWQNLRKTVFGPLFGGSLALPPRSEHSPLPRDSSPMSHILISTYTTCLRKTRAQCIK